MVYCLALPPRVFFVETLGGGGVSRVTLAGLDLDGVGGLGDLKVWLLQRVTTNLKPPDLEATNPHQLEACESLPDVPLLVAVARAVDRGFELAPSSSLASFSLRPWFGFQVNSWLCSELPKRHVFYWQAAGF